MLCVRCHGVISIYFTAIVINTHLRPICGTGHKKDIIIEIKENIFSFNLLLHNNKYFNTYEIFIASV